MTTELLKNLELGLLNDVANFRPELILCGTIILLLLLRLLPGLNRWHLGWVALGGTLVALVWSVRQWLVPVADPDRQDFPAEMFTGLLMYDKFTIYLRLFLLSFTALTI